MREARCEDGTVADEVRSRVSFDDDEAEGVATLKLEEVDVPLEDVDELLHELRTFAFAAQGLVERAVDRGGNGRLYVARHGLMRRHVESVRGADGVDVAPSVHFHLHGIDAAAIVIVKP